MQCSTQYLSQDCSISFNTASGMDCMQSKMGNRPNFVLYVSIPQAVWIACNWDRYYGWTSDWVVSIPQAVWIACNRNHCPESSPLRVSIPQAVWIACNERWKASRRSGNAVSIPQAVWIACNAQCSACSSYSSSRFNTASGMDCMQSSNDDFERQWEAFQYRKRYGLHAIPSLRERTKSLHVSIPQAVWIACNTVSRKPWKQ